MPDALQCIESLVKISNKFDHISVGYVQKTAQKQPKIVLSAGMKLFEISKLENYLINFIRILWFMWDLGLVLFNSHKVLVSGKNFGFWQYFEFSGGKLGPKWTKTINFVYIPFLLKHLILKDLSYERHAPGWNFSKLESYLQEKGPRNLPKGAISWMLHRHENI